MRAILTYHSIDPSGSVISVDPAAFRDQMRWLARSELKVVPLKDLARAENHSVALTFDDGFQNFADVALPVLEEHRLPATLFVVTGRAGGLNDWKSLSGGPAVPLFPLLDWAGIAAAAGRGVDIGSHGRAHVDLAAIAAAEAADDIAGAAADIARETGRTASSFAFPYGSWNEAAARAVADLHAASCTTDLRSLAETASPQLMPRLDVYYFRDMRRFRTLGTAAFLRYIGIRRAMRRARAWRIPLGQS